MTNQQIAQEVLDGKWGNGQDRRKRLEDAGYNYDAVQNIVNQLVWDREQSQPEELPDTEEIPESTGKFLDIEVDLFEYDGIQLRFKGVKR